MGTFTAARGPSAESYLRIGAQADRDSIAAQKGIFDSGRKTLGDYSKQKAAAEKDAKDRIHKELLRQDTLTQHGVVNALNADKFAETKEKNFNDNFNTITKQDALEEQQDYLNLQAEKEFKENNRRYGLEYALKVKDSNAKNASLTLGNTLNSMKIKQLNQQDLVDNSSYVSGVSTTADATPGQVAAAKEAKFDANVAPGQSPGEYVPMSDDELYNKFIKEDKVGKKYAATKGRSAFGKGVDSVGDSYTKALTPVSYLTDKVGSLFRSKDLTKDTTTKKPEKDPMVALEEYKTKTRAKQKADYDAKVNTYTTKVKAYEATNKMLQSPEFEKRVNDAVTTKKTVKQYSNDVRNDIVKNDEYYKGLKPEDKNYYVNKMVKASTDSYKNVLSANAKEVKEMSKVDKKAQIAAYYDELAAANDQVRELEVIAANNVNDKAAAKKLSSSKAYVARIKAKKDSGWFN